MSFFIRALAMVSYWRLSDVKSPHVSKTFLGILAVLNNALVCKRIVSACPLISKSPSLNTNTKCTNYNYDTITFVKPAQSFSTLFSIP